MPVITKNLLIINIICFVARYLVANKFGDINFQFGLYYFDSPNFYPYQFLTHMFLHGDEMHLFFNMFGLWMFGSQLERTLGPKRFLIFYLFCGLGGAILHQAASGYEVYNAVGTLTPGLGDYDPYTMSKNFAQAYYLPAVGASGALMGLLLGFGMLFPNTLLMLIFLPIPIKAKYFVIIYGVMELFLGVQKYSWDNVAHFAHLGGMLFGFILIKIWQHSRKQLY